MHTIPDELEAGSQVLAVLYQTDLDVDIAAANGTGWLSGCALTAQGSPNMTRAVASGSVQIGDSVVTVNSQNTPTVTADGSQPRWVLYEVDGSGDVQVNAGTPASTPLMPSPTSGRVVIGADYVDAGQTALSGAISRDMRSPAASRVRSVNGAVGAVVLTASDVAADPAGTASTAVSAHTGDTSDAHDASAISFSPTGAVVATDVQAAIAELDTDLTSHLNDTTDAHDASAISFSPAGAIAATDVQAALAELDSEKSSTSHNHAGVYDPAGTAASQISTHNADTTNVHGIADTSQLVTTDDVRLTYRVYDGAGAPDNAFGSAESHFIESSTGNIYRKVPDAPVDAVHRMWFHNDTETATNATTAATSQIPGGPVATSGYDLFVVTKNKETFRGQIKTAVPTAQVMQYILLSEVRGRGHPTANSNFGDRLNNNVAWRVYGGSTWVNVDENTSGWVFEADPDGKRDWFLYNNNNAFLIDGTSFDVTDIGTATANTIVTSGAHGLGVNQPIYVTWTANGLDQTKTYYVLTTPTTSSFTVAESPGGATVAFTSTSATGKKVFRASTYFIDPGSTGFRDFFVSQVEAYWDAYQDWEGIMLDNAFLSLGNTAGGIAKRANALVGNTTVKYRRNGVYTAYTNDAYTDAVAGLLSHLKTNLADVRGVPLWANCVEERDYALAWDKYYPYLDGIMYERFATEWGSDNDYTDEVTWEADLTRVEDILANDVKVLCVSHINPPIAVSSVDTSANTITTAVAHGLNPGDAVALSWASGSISATPAITELQTYYVKTAPTTTTLTLTDAPDGNVIDITSSSDWYAVKLYTPTTLDMHKFALASFLLVAEPDVSWFRSTNNGRNSSGSTTNGSYDEIWEFSSDSSLLGTPIGPRYIKSGTTWRREYQAGYVEVDPVGLTATIQTYTAGTWQLVSDALADHLADTVDAHDASAISFSATGNIASTNVQAAIAELDSEKSSTSHNHSGVYDPVGTASGLVNDHLNDTTDAHDASAISFDDTGLEITATDVQTAIEELDAKPDSITVKVAESTVGTRPTLNLISTSIQASAQDNAGTNSIDLTLNLPQFGGILLSGHSYSQLGGGGDSGPTSADRFANWSHIVPAALKVPDSEVKLWGRSGATLSSANSDPTTDFIGSGVFMRHIWPNNSFNGDSYPRTVSDAVTNGTTTLTSATADFKSTDAGKYIVGTDIPANTRIVSVTNSTTVVLSSAATGSGSSRTIIFGSVRTGSKEFPTLNVLMYGYNELRWASSGVSEYNGQEVAINAYKNAIRAVTSRLMASEVYNSLHPLVTKTGSWSAVTNDTIQSGTQYIKTTTNGDTVSIAVPPWFRGGTIGVNFIGCTNYVTALGSAVGTNPAAGTNENWTLAAGTWQGYKNVRNGDLLVIDKGTASEEYVLVNSGAGTTTINVKRGMTAAGAASGSTFTHSNGAFIQLPTTTARVTYATSGDGNLNGTSGSGTVYLAGQGSARPGVLTANATRVHVCKRLALSRADAGKIITFTVAGIPTGSNEEVAFDAYWIEDPDPTHTLWVNQPPTVGPALANGITIWPTINTALSDVVAEFGSNVQVVDVYTKWRNLYNGTWRTSTSTGTSVTFWPYDAQKCVVNVGSVLRTEAEEMLVTAITKTSDTNWDLTVTRNYKGLGGGVGALALSAGNSNHAGSTTRASGAEVSDQIGMSVDRVHPGPQGHMIIASAILEEIATISQTPEQIVSSGLVVGRRQQSYANGQYIIPQLISTKPNTAMTQSRMYTYPIYIAQDCVIDQMAIEVGTGAASSSARLGLYLDQNGLPGYRVADIGAVATTATTPTTYKTISCWIPVKPGWYWIACAVQGGAPSLRAFAPGSRGDGVAMPYTVITDVFTGGTSGTQGNGLYVDSITGELPLNAGAYSWTISGVNVPLIAARVTVPITD